MQEDAASIELQTQKMKESINTFIITNIVWEKIMKDIKPVIDQATKMIKVAENNDKKTTN